VWLKINFRFGIGLDRGGSRRGNGSTSLWTVVEFLKIERPHWRWNNSLAIYLPAVGNIGQWPQGRTSYLKGWKNTLDVCTYVGKTLRNERIMTVSYMSFPEYWNWNILSLDKRYVAFERKMHFYLFKNLMSWWVERILLVIMIKQLFYIFIYIYK